MTSKHDRRQYQIAGRDRDDAAWSLIRSRGKWLAAPAMRNSAYGAPAYGSWLGLVTCTEEEFLEHEARFTRRVTFWKEIREPGDLE